MEPQTFPLFPHLPTELRLKIWHLAALTPRTLHISYLKDSYQAGTTKRFFAKRFLCPTSIPPLLHANHESRSETISHYTLGFGTAHAPPSIYSNPLTDTYRLSGVVLGHLPKAELNIIRSLSVEVTDYLYFNHFNMGIMGRMEQLAELEIVAVRQPEHLWGFGVVGTLIRELDEERKSFRGGLGLLSLRIVNEDGVELAAVGEDGEWTGDFRTTWGGTGGETETETETETQTAAAGEVDVPSTQ